MPAALATQPRGQNPSQCYHCTLDVIIVDVTISASGGALPQFAFAVNPLQLPVGTSFVIHFRVVYPAGTNVSGLPVVLSPPKASFRLTNSSGASYLLTGVNVNPVPNQPGNYTYATSVTSSFPQGPVTAYVLARSLQDAAGNIGPPADVSSTETINPYDSSVITIGPKQVTPPPQTNYLVPSIIFGLIILALILLLVRRRSKQKSKKG